MADKLSCFQPETASLYEQSTALAKLRFAVAEERRRRVRAYRELQKRGFTKSEAARLLRIGCSALWRWDHAFSVGGIEALLALSKGGVGVLARFLQAPGPFDLVGKTIASFPAADGNKKPIPVSCYWDPETDCFEIRVSLHAARLPR